MLAGTAAIIAEGELVNGQFGFLEGSVQQSFYATFMHHYTSRPLSTSKNDHSLLVHDLKTPQKGGTFHSKTITL